MSSTSTTTLQRPNIAITTNPAHDLSIVEVPTPSPAAGECLIHVTATGICGSDVHFWKHGGIGSSKITCELGLGHESAGEIVGLGEGVEGWKVGTFLTMFLTNSLVSWKMDVDIVHKMFQSKSKRTCTRSNVPALSFARQKDMCYVTTSFLSYTQNPRTSYTAANDDFCFQVIE